MSEYGHTSCMVGTLSNLIAAHGYWVVALVVGLESMGLPVPGETTLVSAGIYAGTTGRLNISLVIAAASAGAIVGDNLGYWIGHRFGYRLLLRYGRFLRLTPARIKLGQYLFQQHGGAVVFFGRFMALLRTLAALTAGINWMPWWRFLLFNATGGFVWSMVFGAGSYFLGQQFTSIEGPMSAIGVGLGVAAAAGGLWFAHHHEADLQMRADAALPGPLREPGHPGR